MNPYSLSRFRTRRDQGFTLVEIAVVLIIAAIMIAMAAILFRGINAGQKRALTASRLAGIDAALVQFVALQKRLPCPADGMLANTAANAGAEMARDATGCIAQVPSGLPAQQNGVVPWRALGISEADASDGWDRRLTYRVSPLLAADSGMDMSKCDPAGTEGIAPNPILATPRACNVNCVSTALNQCTPPLHFLATKGFTIQTIAGTQVMLAPSTGAAYVVISHGESGGGAYSSSGTLQASSSTDGTEELRNYANQTLPAGWYFVDDSPSEVAGNTHFDDMLSRPSVLTVINKAGLGPRSHGP